MLAITLTVDQKMLMRVIGGAIKYRNTKLKKGGANERQLSAALLILDEAFDAAIATRDA
jgi:hypothetical protein